MTVWRVPASAQRLLPIGVVTGFLSGLLGVGGGVVMVPALIWVGYQRQQANSISLAVILVISIAGMVGFAAGSALDVLIGLALGLGGVVGATIGARWANGLSGTALARIFGVLLLVTGIQMLIGGQPTQALLTLSAPWYVVVASMIGAGAGIVSGLAGVGGGVILVPAMVFLLGLDQHTAEGTSLMAICFTSAAATRVNISSGYLEGRAVALLAAGGVILAPVSATLAQSIPAVTLSRIFALWLLLIAGKTLTTTRADPTGST